MDKITIVYGLPDTNSGGSALGISLIKVLKSHFPGCRINYVSSHSRKDLIEKAYPFIKARYPEVAILPYPLMARADSYDIKGKYCSKLKKVLWALKTVFSVIFVIFPSLKNNKTLDEIKDSSLIVGRGTNIFYDKRGGLVKSIQSVVAQYWLCFPLLMAWRYNKPYIIYAQSFGPLHNPINRLLIRFVFNKAFLVLPREELSRDYLRNVIKINNDKIRLVPDSVFSLEPPNTESIKKICQTYSLPYKRYLVLIVRQLMNEGDNVANRFSILRNVFNYLKSNNVIEKCVIVTQCNRFEEYDGFENDSKISNELFKYLREGSSNSVDLIDKLLSPDELLCLYGGARYVITFRLHSAIFSLISGTPTLAISYWGFKTKGIMKMLGLSSRAIDVDRLETDVIATKLEEMEKNYDLESNYIATQINRIHKIAYRTPLLFKS